LASLRPLFPSALTLSLLLFPAVPIDREALPPLDVPSVTKVYENLTYRTVGGQTLQLDLAVPAGPGPFPVIVFLHGGSWIVGDRARYRDEIEVAADRGFVGVTVNYRLCKTGEDTPSVDGFPAALHDVKAAIRFLRTNASRYRIDPDRIGIGGQSAGGHLALLAGLTRPEDGLEGDMPPGAPSSAVRAVVNIFGPTDVAALARDNPISRPVLVMLLGAQPEAAPERFRRASPVNYARRDAPPILTLHGSADTVVPVVQARRLDAALKKAGARHELVVLPGGGHGFRGPLAERSARLFYEFFEQTLKGPAR
jgi:acetyl esterase/lipase